MRLEAESYGDHATAEFINQHFIPFTANKKDGSDAFQRFNAVWTPTIIIASPDGEERHRIEGYVPKDEFQAQLKMGLARVETVANRWDEAERWYDAVAREHPESSVASEAFYWRAVSQYNREHDPKPLAEVATQLRERFPDSIWARKASVWLG